MKQAGSGAVKPDSTLSISIPSYVAYEDFDGEVIIINLNIGLYHSLNDTAGFIWLRIADGDAPERVVDDLADKYSISGDLARSMVASLIRDIEDVELVQIDGTRPEWVGLPAGEMPGRDTPPLWPVLETYRDMHHALVLDPIHEVDESGWPKPKSQSPSNGTE